MKRIFLLFFFTIALYQASGQHSTSFPFIRKDGYYKYDNGATKVIPMEKEEMKKLDGILKVIDPADSGVDSMAKKMPGGVIPGEGSPTLRYLFFTSDSTGVIANSGQRDSATEARIISGFEAAQRGEPFQSSKLINVRTWDGRYFSYDVSTNGIPMTHCVGFVFPDALAVLEVILVFPYSADAFANKKVYQFHPFPAKR